VIREIDAKATWRDYVWLRRLAVVFAIFGWLARTESPWTAFLCVLLSGFFLLLAVRTRRENGAVWHVSMHRPPRYR
jgi:hypothetical protein